MREISLNFSDRDILQKKYLVDLGEDGDFVFYGPISYDGAFVRGKGVLYKGEREFSADIIIQIEKPLPLEKVAEENWTAGDLLSLGWSSYDVQ